MGATSEDPFPDKRQADGVRGSLPSCLRSRTCESPEPSLLGQEGKPRRDEGGLRPDRAGGLWNPWAGGRGLHGSTWPRGLLLPNVKCLVELQAKLCCLRVSSTPFSPVMWVLDSHRCCDKWPRIQCRNTTVVLSRGSGSPESKTGPHRRVPCMRLLAEATPSPCLVAPQPRSSGSVVTSSLTRFLPPPGDLARWGSGFPGIRTWTSLGTFCVSAASSCCL